VAASEPPSVLERQREAAAAQPQRDRGLLGMPARALPAQQLLSAYLKMSSLDNRLKFGILNPV